MAGVLCRLTMCRAVPRSMTLLFKITSFSVAACLACWKCRRKSACLTFILFKLDKLSRILSKISSGYLCCWTRYMSWSTLALSLSNSIRELCRVVFSLSSMFLTQDLDSSMSLLRCFAPASLCLLVRETCTETELFSEAICLPVSSPVLKAMYYFFSPS